MTQYDAVWEAIKDWDIERKPGDGYAHATGTDVTIILEALWKADAAVSDFMLQSVPAIIVEAEVTTATKLEDK
jgi:hypothetical protein